MKQASLKLKRYVSNVKVLDNNLEHHILRTILVSFGILGLIYMFILGSMVFDIVERRSLEKEVLSLSNDVGSLELDYLSLSNKVNLNFSYSLGFRQVKPKFATRQILGFNSSSLDRKLDNEI